MNKHKPSLPSNRELRLKRNILDVERSSWDSVANSFLMGRFKQDISTVPVDDEDYDDE